MSSSDESNFSKGFLFGAFIGGVAGAVTALLLAPKTGVEFRKDLADTSADLYVKASDYFKKTEMEVAEMVNDSKYKAQGIIDNARSKAEDLLHDAEEVLKDARLRASTSKENIQNKIDTVKDAIKAGSDAFKDEIQRNA
ncbi:MAG TPA: YtxH domain-containing protein [Candidatus Kapabacteria bacterium]|nr:YtxH domain-containing protein [Candidatus Kapabacteria bacterium]